MGADPNDPVAAFTEYAQDRLWIASHLLQLAGVAAMMAALLFLAGQLEARKRSSVVRIAAAGAIATLTLAAALQAVDGIALKSMVDTWAAAPASEKEGVFHATFAIRQVEIGLASMLSLSFGLTMTLYGIALLGEEAYPKWFAGLAIAGSVPTIVGGVVMAYTGFSGLAMAINMPANFLLLFWMLALAGLMWRQGGTVR
ncbi:MAG: hypothetical protein O6945_14290 [Gammaproteobacteria bacterium]|nr:hypothetical protein [Gammaproteobacteria bacterium]